MLESECFDKCWCGASARFIKHSRWEGIEESSWQVECTECAECTETSPFKSEAMCEWNKKIRKMAEGEKMCELITKIKDRIDECVKTANSYERDKLRTVLGEIQTVQSRTGKMDDEGVIKIFKKFKQGVKDTIKLLEKEGAEGDLSYLKIEVELYDKFIPSTMSVFEIVDFLDAHVNCNPAIRDAKSDGQATGIAMRACKEAKLSVDGKDVSEAVKALRFPMPKCNCLTKSPEPQYHAEDCPVSKGGSSEEKLQDFIKKRRGKNE